MFKVTLRELFLLVTLAALGCAWWTQYRETCILREDVNASQMWKEYFQRDALESKRLLLSLSKAIQREGYYAVGGKIGEVKITRDETIRPIPELRTSED